MAAGEQVPDRAWLTLGQRGDIQVLEHHGTGERVDLPLEADERYSLLFSTSGVALLRHPSRGDALASSLLKHSLKRLQREGCDEPSLACVSSAGSTWLSTLAKTFATMCFKGVASSCMKQISVEVFRFHVRASGSYLWWGLQRIRAFVFPAVEHHNWAGKNRMRWEGIIEQLGGVASDIWPSNHSVKRRRNDGDPFCDEPRIPDFAFSTQGLLLMLLYWHVRDRRQAAGAALESANAAAAVIDALVERFLGDQHVLVQAVSALDHASFISVRQGRVEFRDIASLGKGFKTLVRSMLQ